MMNHPDLDELTPGIVETIAFWVCVIALLGLVIGSISFGTGLLWADYIHPAIVKVLTWALWLLP